MSYVFSKALQQQKPPTEERQRRKTLPTGWDTTVPSNLDHVTAERIPPTVAPKPKHDNADQISPNQTSNGASRSAAFRNTGLRSFSFDAEASAVPKMGGAFARLQANLENPNTTTSSIYSEKYEAYRIQRSLKEHGVLPSELRSNEQLQKYGIDKVEPPKVLPKPSRGSVENKRGAFSKNRSETMPSPSTNKEESFFHKNTSFGSLDHSDLVISEEHFTKQTPNTDDNEVFKTDVKPEIKPLEDIFVRENIEIAKGQRQLNETIEELESMSFELDSNKGASFFEKTEIEQNHHQAILESDAIKQDEKTTQDEHVDELSPHSAMLSLSELNQLNNQVEFPKVSDELKVFDNRAESSEFLNEKVDNSVELINSQKDMEKGITDLVDPNGKIDQSQTSNSPNEQDERQEAKLGDDLSTHANTHATAVDFNNDRIEGLKVEEGVSLTTEAGQDDVLLTQTLVEKVSKTEVAEEESSTNEIVEEESSVQYPETILLNKNELEENTINSPTISLESDSLLESEMNLTQEISALLETNLFSKSPLEENFSLHHTNDNHTSHLKEELDNNIKVSEPSDKSDSTNAVSSNQIFTEINPKHAVNEHTVDEHAVDEHTVDSISFETDLQKSIEHQTSSDLDVETNQKHSLLQNELRDESDGVVKSDDNNNSSYNFDTAL